MKRTSQTRALPVEQLARAAQVLKLLAHPHRLKAVELLESRAETPVYAVAEWIGLPPAATSQHLNQMRRAGLVEAVRRGREVHYRIADQRALRVLGCVRKGETCV